MEIEIKNESGIGELNEHILHATLKNLIDPDKSHHEVIYQGSVVDILNDEGITEIETRSFTNLKKKIGKLLEDNRVNVVFPISEHYSYIIVSENGEKSEPKKSPKKGKPSDVFPELLKIADFIGNKNLTVTLFLLDTLEYRTAKRGRRKGYIRSERVPVHFNGKVDLKTVKDVKSLVNIPSGDFSAAEFNKLNKFREYYGWKVLKCLENCGALSCDKSQRRFIYHSIDITDEE